MKSKVFKVLQLVSLVAGIGLFIYLVHQTGVDTLLGYASMMGWGAVIILAISGFRNVFRAGSWFLAIEPAHRTVGFWNLMNVMLAGEAIKYLTATGPLLSEAAKAAMVRKDVPLLHGVSSVVAENLIYYVTVFIFMIAGLPALALLDETSSSMVTISYMITGGMLVFTIIFWSSVRGRWYPAALVLEAIQRRRGDAGKERRGVAADDQKSKLERVAKHVRGVEENLYSFYSTRRADFLAIVLLNLSAHVINIFEVCLILNLMRLPSSLASGFVIEAATKLINLVFFFVPARAGVYESGNALVFEALGMTTGAGVALAIIRKIRALVWVAYGLGVIGMRTLRRPNSSTART